MPLSGLDAAGLQAAYDAHRGDIYHFAFRRLGDVGHAQDAVQETFLRAWRAAHRYDPELASLRVWLFAIARNVVIDDARRRSRATWPLVPRDETVVAEALNFVADASDGLLDAWVIDQALSRLSPGQREVIVATYLMGLSYEEVAVLTGVRVGTLRSRCFYGLKALRVGLDEESDGAAAVLAATDHRHAALTSSS